MSAHHDIGVAKVLNGTTLGETAALSGVFGTPLPRPKTHGGEESARRKGGYPLNTDVAPPKKIVKGIIKTK